VQKAFEEATGKSIEMRPVEKAGLEDFYAAVFPPMVVKEYVGMNLSYLEGGILYEDPEPTEEKKYAKMELVEVFKGMLGA
jgi:hypothetical protein